MLIVAESDVPFTKMTAFTFLGLAVVDLNNLVARPGFCQNRKIMGSIGRVQQHSTVAQGQCVLGTFA